MKNPAVSGGDDRRLVRGERSSIASVIERGGSLQGLRKSLRTGLLQTHAGYVPRVELTQVASSAEQPQMLDGAVHRPVELNENLRARGSLFAQAEQAGEQPWVAERATCKHHGSGTRLVEGGASRLDVAQTTGEDHGR